MRIVQRFHPALHRTIRTDIDETGVDRRMVLRRFRDGLIDGNSHEAAAVRNLVGLAGVRRIDEGQDIQRALDQVTELGHPARGVDTSGAPLNDHIGIFICQDTHRDLPLSSMLNVSHEPRLNEQASRSRPALNHILLL